VAALGGGISASRPWRSGGPSRPSSSATCCQPGRRGSWCRMRRRSCGRVG